jgi:nicotinamide-nucleotide amidase
VVAALVGAGLTVATAESLTGGLVAAALTSVPGSSAVVRGGVVAYATDLKHSLLGVDDGLLARVGAVHADVAAAMARGAAERLGADLGVACTGVAGPDPQDGQPPGTVFVALVRAADGHVVARSEQFVGGREDVRAATVAACLDLLAAATSGPGNTAAAR